MRHTAFKAIADPTRREIIALLADTGESLPITSITERFQTSRQAVTKHIKILHAAGLIEIQKRGRERYCSVNVRPLQDVYIWVTRYKLMGEAAAAEPTSVQRAPGALDSDMERPQDFSALRPALYRAVSVM